MTQTTTRTDPVAVVAAIYERFGAGDLDGILAFVDTGADWGPGSSAPGAELVPMLDRGQGHDAVRHYFGGVMALEFDRFEPVRMVADGDVVLSELRIACRHRATGKATAFDEIHHFTVRDGSVVRFTSFVDTAALIEVFRP